MLRWALIFLILALVSAAFGFGGIAAASAGIAKTLFLVFFIFAIISFVASLVSGRARP